MSEHGINRTIFFTDKPSKRIDFVLAYNNSPEHNEKLIRLEEIHNNLSETSLSGTRTFLQTRETYMKNLQTLYDVDYEHHESSLKDGNVSFYLVHVPFSTLEKYAIELQINKRVNEDYVNMAQSNVSFEEILKSQEILGASRVASRMSLHSRSRTGLIPSSRPETSSTQLSLPNSRPNSKPNSRPNSKSLKSRPTSKESEKSAKSGKSPRKATIPEMDEHSDENFNNINFIPDMLLSPIDSPADLPNSHNLATHKSYEIKTSMSHETEPINNNNNNKNIRTSIIGKSAKITKKSSQDSSTVDNLDFIDRTGHYVKQAKTRVQDYLNCCQSASKKARKTIAEKMSIDIGDDESEEGWSVGTKPSQWDDSKTGGDSVTIVYQKNIRHIFENIYVEGSSDGKNVRLNEDGFFTTTERAKITRYLMGSCPYVQNYTEGNLAFGIDSLLPPNQWPVFDSVYPLHDSSLLDDATGVRYDLSKDWGSIRFEIWGKKQPLNKIRKYFGEKIAMYFAWLGYYNKFLFYAAILGFLPVIWGWYNVNNRPVIKDYCSTNSTFQETYLCPSFNKDSCIGHDCEVQLVTKDCELQKLRYILNDNIWTVAYAIFMSVWACLFLEFWKRQQFHYAVEWDVTDIEEINEPMRASYRATAATSQGDYRTNPVTLKSERYVPGRIKLPYKIFSMAFSIFFVCLVVIALFAIQVQYAMFKKSFAMSPLFSDNLFIPAKVMGTVVAGTMTFVVIVILNICYDKFAEKLTELEYHRTASKFEASIIFKKFWFRIANFYSPLVFLMVKDVFRGSPGNYFWHGCGDGGCTWELGIFMVIICIAKQYFQAIIENVLPKVTLFFKRFLLKKNVNSDTEINKKRHLSRWEEDFQLEPIEEMTLFNEYLEMVIQYGFITLFVAAFPLAPICAILNNALELRGDAKKFVRYRRKPVAETAMNIGEWEPLLVFLSKLAVFTNAFIITFTSTTVDKSIYLAENGSFKGYLNSTLTGINTECFQPKGNLEFSINHSNSTLETCYYYNNNNLLFYWNPLANQTLPENCTLETTKGYWKNLSLKMLFVLAVYVVWSVQHIIDRMIPDKSQQLQNGTKREKHLARLILKQAEKYFERSEETKALVLKNFKNKDVTKIGKNVFGRKKPNPFTP